MSEHVDREDPRRADRGDGGLRQRLFVFGAIAVLAGLVAWWVTAQPDETPIDPDSASVTVAASGAAPGPPDTTDGVGPEMDRSTVAPDVTAVAGGIAPPAELPPAAPRPQVEIELSERELLHDGGSIIVSAEDVGPNELVYVLQCGYEDDDDAGTIDSCDLSNLVQANSDQTGYVEAELITRRMITTDGQLIDCAAPERGRCYVALATADIAGAGGRVEVTYDPDVLDPDPSPILIVNQFNGLVDQQVLTIEGRNFTPGGSINLVQCVLGGEVGGTQGANCLSPSVITNPVADGDGGFSITWPAERYLNRVDCFDLRADQRCVIVGNDTATATTSVLGRLTPLYRLTYIDG